MMNDVVPNGCEVLHQLFLACLCIEVGHAGIEIVCSDGMPHCLVLVAQLVAVLIVVFAIGHGVADGNQAFGQREIFLFARLPIHLCSTHVVTGTDGIA